MHIGSIFFIVGIVTHLGIFGIGEHHMNGLLYLQIFSGIFLVFLSTLSATGRSFAQALFTTSTLASHYLTGVYGSLLIYRIFLSPLRHFPGPWLAKVSALNFAFQVRSSNANKVLLKLHQEHGDFVRIGSSDLSITHPKAIDIIYGRGSTCTKAAWYDLTSPLISMQTTRERSVHDERRRIWGSAFNDAALRDYEDRITTYQAQLTNHIKAQGEQAIDVKELFNRFNFDIMGDLAFGKKSRVLISDENHWAMKLLYTGLRPLGLMLPIWCFRILLAYPRAMGDWFKFMGYCCQSLEERMHAKTDTTNILSFLLKPWENRKLSPADYNMLQGDSQLIIVAASETTASSLTSILYELARTPDRISRLRYEITTLVNSGKPLSNQNLQSLDFLNGVINETLRLYPPTGLLQRKTPPGGIMIGETHVPGDVTVFCPFYVVGRSETSYTDATEFEPERWYAKPEMIKEAGAYAPFSKGPYNCIGKPLALLNLRTTLAKLIMDFDFSFAKGEDGTRFFEKARTDFVASPGDLSLSFRKREGV